MALIHKFQETWVDGGHVDLESWGDSGTFEIGQPASIQLSGTMGIVGSELVIQLAVPWSVETPNYLETFQASLGISGELAYAVPPVVIVTLDQTAPIGLTGSLGIQGEPAYQVPVVKSLDQLAALGLQASIGVQGETVYTTASQTVLDQGSLVLAASLGIQGEPVYQVPSAPVLVTLNQVSPLGITASLSLAGALHIARPGQLLIAAEAPLELQASLGIAGVPVIARVTTVPAFYPVGDLTLEIIQNITVVEIN